MKILQLLFSFLVLTSPLLGQKSKNLVESKSIAGPGSIVLKDGTKLDGEMVFNERTTLLSFYQGGDSVQLSANAMTSFQYYDAGVESMRTFYTFESDDTPNGAAQTFIFELLKQYTSFAVLARRLPPDPELVRKAYGSSLVTVKWWTASQDERVYLMKNDDHPIAFLEITYKKLEKDREEKTDKRGHILNKKALDVVLGAKAEKVRKYSFDNRISLHNKEELIIAMDYAESLEKNP